MAKRKEFEIIKALSTDALMVEMKNLNIRSDYQPQGGPFVYTEDDLSMICQLMVRDEPDRSPCGPN